MDEFVNMAAIARANVPCLPAPYGLRYCSARHQRRAVNLPAPLLAICDLGQDRGNVVAVNTQPSMDEFANMVAIARANVPYFPVPYGLRYCSVRHRTRAVHLPASLPAICDETGKFAFKNLKVRVH